MSQINYFINHYTARQISFDKATNIFRLQMTFTNLNFLDSEALLRFKNNTRSND